MRKCNHNTFFELLKVNGHPLLIGARVDLEDYLVSGGRPWLVVDLTGSNMQTRATTITYVPVKKNKALDVLVKKAELNFERLAIDWTDRSIPTFDRKFWEAFLDVLRVAEGPVFIHCVGGHGRTGTMAAILVGMLDGFDLEGLDPITYIRKVYCDDAVESKIQVYYVQQMTGKDCTEPMDELSCSVTYNTNIPQSIPSSPASTTPISVSVGANAVWPVNKPNGAVEYTATKSAHAAIMDVTKDMYDDLNWQNGEYVDSEGTPIGASLSDAVHTLKRRKNKHWGTNEQVDFTDVDIQA